jgi:hypothetical protein
MRFRRTLIILIGALAASIRVSTAQTVTGQLTGTVVDASGAIIVGASAQITSEVTRQVREFSTGSNGTFVFPDLVPGTYDLKIAQEGFKTFVQNGIVVGTLEKVDVHTIALQLGDFATSVEVTAPAARVETDSSDHTIDVDANLIKEIPLRGRNFEGVIRSLPGVIDLGSGDQRGWGTASAVINGGQAGQVLVTLDGIAAQDSGSLGLNTYQSPSPDAINEVRLLTSNYAAEYGARNGASSTCPPRAALRNFTAALITITVMSSSTPTSSSTTQTA